MSKSGELETRLPARSAVTDFSRVDQMLKSGEYGSRREMGYDGNRQNTPASSPDCKTRHEAMPSDRGIPPKSSARAKAPPKTLFRADCRDGASASYRLARLGENAVRGPENESASAMGASFRDGGENRAIPLSMIERVRNLMTKRAISTTLIRTPSQVQQGYFSSDRS